MSINRAQWIFEECFRILLIPVNVLGINTSYLEVLLWLMVAILIADIIVKIFHVND